MKFPLLLQSHLNGAVRLTQERWEHIEKKRRQGELRPSIDEIMQTLQQPHEVRASNHDPVWGSRLLKHPAQQVKAR